MSLAVATATALVLSLGPSLKFYDYPRDPSAKGSAMPAHEATFGLPTTLLYEHLPGFSDMRATFRWVVPAILCLLLLAGITVSRCWRSGRRPLAAALGVVALIDVVPDIPTFVSVFERERSEVAAYELGPAEEFRELVAPGEVVLLLPAANDFLANDLVPASGASSFNVGIDKNARYSSAAWPQEVKDASATYNRPDGRDAAARALDGTVDAIVFPNFHLSRQALVWPPAPEFAAQRRQIAGRYAADPRFEADVGTWFTVIRLRE